MPHARPFPCARFIVNPISAARAPGVEDLIRRESARICIEADTVHTARAGHATGIARQAAEEGVDLVVAVGGDGTVNEIANGLVDTDTALGVVPLGTGNALARALGIPINAAAACRMLGTAETARIDVGRVGDRYFLSTMGVGVDAEVCRLFSNTPARKRGFLRYAGLTAQAVWTFVPKRLSIEVDGRPWFQGTPLLAIVANTPQYGHGATIAPGAVPHDGLLDLCVLDPPGLIAASVHAIRLFTGTIDRMPGYRKARTARVRIVRARPGCYQVDGESLEGGEVLDIQIVPRALRIALPARR